LGASLAIAVVASTAVLGMAAPVASAQGGILPTAGNLVISAPSTVAPDQGFTFTVTLENSTGYTGTVDANVSGDGYLTSATSQSISSGQQVSFTAESEGSGSISISVSASNSLVVGTPSSDSAVVPIGGVTTNGSCADVSGYSFGISLPSTATAGSPVEANITACYNGTPSGYPGEVSLSSTDSAASFNPQTVAFDGSETAYSEVTFETNGEQYVTASGDDGGSGTSNLVDVGGVTTNGSCADVSGYSFGVSVPSSATVGQPTTVGLTSCDNGTLAPYYGNVNLTSSDPAATFDPSSVSFNGNESATAAVTFETSGTQYVYAAGTAGGNGTSNPVAVTGSTSVSIGLTRYGGSTRDQTAELISQAQWTAGSAQAVVLARNDDYPDALAGGPLAVKMGGPLLLTPTSGLTSSVQAEIQRVLPTGKTVYVLGGVDAISSNVVSQLEGLGYNVTRLGGNTRYGTAIQIAQALGDPTTVFLATGINYPDALSAGPAAALNDGTILLTDGSSESSDTAAYLAAHPGATVYAVGGPACSADPAATCLMGSDRYGTATALATHFFPNATVAGFATGLNYPDALTGGPFMAAKSGPIILVPTSGALPSEDTSYLSDQTGITTGYVFGGTAAVGSDVYSEIQSRE
jgi:putative cell wall-binding protein